jgi:hypothetical protein
MQSEIEQLKAIIAEKDALIKKLQNRCCSPSLFRCSIHNPKKSEADAYSGKPRAVDPTKRKTRVLPIAEFNTLIQDKRVGKIVAPAPVVKKPRRKHIHPELTLPLSIDEEYLTSLNLKDLKQVCKQKKMKGFSKVTKKQELIHYILERV